MPTQLSGRSFILGFAVVIAIIAAIGFVILRGASEGRFAISIHMIPESPHADLVSLGNPILVRIDKRSAGRSPLTAYAMLLDGNGRLLADLKPLSAHALPNGKRGEDAVFPPLETLPGQRLLAAIVIRISDDRLAEARTRITQILQPPEQATAGKKPRAQLSLPNVFSRVLVMSRELGGRAELAQVEVRERL